MAICKWVTEPDGFRCFVPSCHGGIDGPEHCVCIKSSDLSDSGLLDRLEELRDEMSEVHGQIAKRKRAGVWNPQEAEEAAHATN